MGTPYQNKLFTFLNAIQQDLKENRIDEKQFNFLMGVALKKELNNFIQQELAGIAPEAKEEQKKMTLFSYKRNRTFNHA